MVKYLFGCRLKGGKDQSTLTLSARTAADEKALAALLKEMEGHGKHPHCKKHNGRVSEIELRIVA